MTAIAIKSLTPEELGPWLKQQPESTRRWLKAQQFSANAEQLCLVPSSDGALERVVCGVGDQRNVWSLGHLPSRLPDGRYQLDEDWSDPATELLALGFELGAYRFERYVKPREGRARLEIPDTAADSVARMAKAVNLVRDLVNTPAEDMGPAELSAAVRETAGHFSAQFDEAVGEALLEENFPAVYAVGRAAVAPPRMLRLHWGDPGQPLLVLVGKGVCFDSGGLDIKSAEGMKIMKKDMGGAAHALAAAQLVMQLKLPVRLLLLIPAVENAIAGNAYRPGDVVHTRKGLSVEIGNTDAEGRVVLSDALAYAGEQSPDLIVDFATLTGAARVALGTDVPALFASRDSVAREIMACGEVVGDPVWQMPLFQPYNDLLKSPIADLNNIASIGFGGCITAALFLQRFVPKDVDWCHIDTYAWNQNQRPGRPKGGEALSLRAVAQYLQRRYGG